MIWAKRYREYRRWYVLMETLECILTKKHSVARSSGRPCLSEEPRHRAGRSSKVTPSTRRQQRRVYQQRARRVPLLTQDEFRRWVNVFVRC